jgi:hypothetical protein
MIKTIIKVITRRKNVLDIEGFLLANNFVVHDINKERNKVVYNKNMQNIVIVFKGQENGVEKGSILFDINGDTMFKINFIPTSVSLFEYLYKESIRNYTNN